MTYSHENPPPGYLPCTREAGHSGPCALPVAMPEYTVWVREIDELLWMEFRFDAPTEYDAKMYALHWFGNGMHTFELYAPGHVRIYVFNAD